MALKGDGDSESSLAATFERPVEGQQVPFRLVSPSGTVVGLGPKTLWLFNKKTDESRVRPQQVPCVVKAGNWRCSDLFLGRGPTQDRGAVYELSLMAAGPAADRRFRQVGALPDDDPERYTGFNTPIPGTRYIDSIRVTRK